MLGARGLNMAVTCVTVIVLLGTISAYTFKTSVSKRDMHRCHDGIRDSTTRCHEYVNYKPHDSRVKRQEGDADEVVYPELDAYCENITWQEANRTNNWGNCFNMTTDDTHRYISSNTVPDFFYNVYCPIGLGYGYCIDLEIELGRCVFPNLTCGDDNGPGSGATGDYWVPLLAYFKIPLEGNPTRDDRPGDMYDADTVGAVKPFGPVTSVAINGIGILGPNDAGSISIDEAGFQLVCGGHVTPPLSLLDASIFPPPPFISEGNESIAMTPSGPPPAPPPPMYHYHKAPDCLEPYTSDYLGVSRGATSNKHGKLTAWALDGFGLYTYYDVGGLNPIVDECGGHFGPVTDDEDAEVVYHYHTRPYVPYTIACQGPALGRCNETQGDESDFCHYGCGAEVCVQPGTKEIKLKNYLDQWDSTWLAKYTVNDYKATSDASGASLVLTYCLAMIQVSRLFW